MKGIQAAFVATLSNDPELKRGKTGHYANFSCSVAKEGSEPSWVNVITFGSVAEVLLCHKR
jgi:hypothetical protein